MAEATRYAVKIYVRCWGPFEPLEYPFAKGSESLQTVPNLGLIIHKLRTQRGVPDLGNFVYVWMAREGVAPK